jgi:RNA polymerase sporulation-specific sigma factor
MSLSFIMVLAASVIKGITLLASYIANNTFPLPLSEKDERIYLQRLKSGEEDARNVLIERNLRLVAHIVKKFDNTGEDVDDLISIGTIGLIKAINTFDPAKKIRLATYAARCIENEILMHLRSTRRIRTEVSLYDPIGVDKEGNEFTLSSYLSYLLIAIYLGNIGYSTSVNSLSRWCFSLRYVVYFRTDFNIWFLIAGSLVLSYTARTFSNLGIMLFLAFSRLASFLIAVSVSATAFSISKIRSESFKVRSR